jgi:hypothetical protein
MLKLILSLGVIFTLQSCAIYSVADAAVSITSDVVSTGVHVVTGTVNTVVDVVTPSKSK